MKLVLIIIILLFVAPLSVCGLLLIYYTIIHEIKSNLNIILLKVFLKCYYDIRNSNPSIKYE